MALVWIHMAVIAVITLSSLGNVESLRCYFIANAPPGTKPTEMDCPNVPNSVCTRVSNFVNGKLVSVNKACWTTGSIGVLECSNRTLGPTQVSEECLCNTNLCNAALRNGFSSGFAAGSLLVLFSVYAWFRV